MPSMGPMPKPTVESLAWFESLVPDAPEVTVRPMFGNKAAFVNGNMFLALFGPSVAVRLSPDDQARLLQERGSAVFEPMPGRAMKEYVVLPDSWRTKPSKSKPWVDRSLEFAGTLPPKKK